MIDIIGMKEFISTADASTASRCFKRAGTMQRVGNKYIWHYKNHRLVVDPSDALGKYRAWCFTGDEVIETFDCENVWNAMAEIERMVDDELLATNDPREIADVVGRLNSALTAQLDQCKLQNTIIVDVFLIKPLEV